MRKIILISVIVGIGLLLSGCVNLSSSILSVAFVNDYSGSMSATAVSNMETAVKTFIGYMQPNDKGEYIAFGSTVINVSGGFLPPSTLVNYVKRGGAGGATVLYDAIYQGLADLSGQPSDHVKALIVLTDGWDYTSSHTATDVFNYAKTLKIPVFTIGLGSAVNDVPLKEIANQTGGKYYYAPTSADLLAIYRSLIKIVTGRIYLY